jgi:hypothetical protein
MKMSETKQEVYEQMHGLMSQLALAALAVTTLAVTLVALLGAR